MDDIDNKVTALPAGREGLNQGDIDHMENQANNLWSRGKLKEREADQRLKASDLMKEAGEYFKQSQEIYSKIDNLRKIKRAE